MFGLIERFRYISREDSIHRAHHNKNNGVAKCYHVGSRYEGSTHKEIVLTSRIVVNGAGR